MIRRQILIWYLRDKFKRRVRHQYALHHQELIFGQSFERRAKFSLRIIIKGLREGLPFDREVLDVRDIRFKEENGVKVILHKVGKKLKRYKSLKNITGNVYYHSGSQKSNYKIPNHE